MSNLYRELLHFDLTFFFLCVHKRRRKGQNDFYCDEFIEIIMFSELTPSVPLILVLQCSMKQPYN